MFVKEDGSSVKAKLSQLQKAQSSIIVKLEGNSVKAKLVQSSKAASPILVKEEGKEVKILSDSHFWVEASNELVHAVSSNFAQKVDIGIKSLDD